MRNFESFIKNKRNVLIIDDCSVYRTAVKGMFLKLGFESDSVLVAADALSANVIARSNDLKLIICDYNLEEKANGYQVLNDLISLGRISSDCVLVIVTGDSSYQVVSGFAELEPDGYIIKPLNYLTLAKRLPKWVYKKHTLSNILRAYDEGKYEEVSTIKTSFNSDNQDLNNTTTLIEAKAQYHQGNYTQAQKSALKLLNTPVKAKALRLLTKINLKSEDYPRAEQVVREMYKAPHVCAKSICLHAELAYKTNNLSLAFEKIEESIEHSPNNCNHHLIRTYLALAGYQQKNALKFLDKTQKLAKYSLYDSVDLYLLQASLLIDLAFQMNNYKKLPSLLAQIENVIVVIKKKYPSSQSKSIELLLCARKLQLLDKTKQASELLNEYILLTNEDSEYQPSFIEQAEFMKVSQIINNDNSLTTWLDNIKNNDNLDYNSLDQLSYSKYLKSWLSKFDAQKLHVQRLDKKCKQLQQLKNYNAAITMLIKSFNYSPNNPDIALSIIKVLTKSWPNGWNRCEVEQLVKECTSVLTDQGVESLPVIIEVMKTLATQLKLQKIA